MTFVWKGRLHTWALPLGLAVALMPMLARADEASDAALEEEVRYIDALSRSGYANFAPAVIEAAQKRWPAAKGVLEAATIRAELMSGKQDEVAKKIAARPDQNSQDTWLLKLELANSYAMYSKFTEADKLYAEFFKRFPKVDAAARKSYLDGINQYILMLGKIDRAKDALPYYKLAMEMSGEESTMANFRAQYLQALLFQAEAASGAEREKMLGEADGLTKKMVWKQDAFFGDAINGMAHIKMLRGDVAGAQEMIKEYLDVLQEIHESYREIDPNGDKGVLRMSPLPQCRYLIGSMLYGEVKKEIAKGGAANEETIKSLLLGERDPKTRKRNGQGAFNHLVQVYMNYPESQSASNAGDLVEEIQALLKSRYNQVVKVNVSADQRAKVRKQQYVGANVKFDSGDWNEAANAFSKTISAYGLNAEALPALRKMVECYVRGGVKGGKLDPMAQFYAETVTAAMAEGFSGMADLYAQAGDELNRVGNFYGEQGLVAQKEKTHQLFFRYYPKHPAAVSLQLQIAKEKAEAGDGDGAEKLYTQVAEAATDAAQRQNRFAALIGLIKLYSPSGAKADAEQEIATAKALVAHFADLERPGINGATAQRLYGDAQRHQADALRKAATPETQAETNKRLVTAYALAASTYDKLIKELEKPDSIYVAANSERKEADTLCEGLYYLRGVCMQLIPATGVEAKDKAIKQKALAYFQECLAKSPKGANAPKALLQIGTLQAAAGDIEASRATLAKLAKDFPTSDEAKNSVPLLADSLFKMGMIGEATNTYKQMFAAGGSYTPAQYQTAAEKLLDAKEYKLAIEACDCILKAKNAAPYLPKAMTLRARALLADRQVEAAYKQVTAMLEKYGRSQAAVEANLLLIDVAGAEILLAKTPEERNKIISEAKKAVTFVTSQAKDDVALVARLNLAVAEVAGKAYESTKSANADKEVVTNAIGSALNAYRSAMFAGETPKTDPSVTAYLQQAYLGYVRLSIERAELAADKQEKQDFLQDAVDIGTEYLETFPEGLFKADVTNAVTTAKINLGQ